MLHLQKNKQSADLFFFFLSKARHFTTYMFSKARYIVKSFNIWCNEKNTVHITCTKAGEILESVLRFENTICIVIIQPEQQI